MQCIAFFKGHRTLRYAHWFLSFTSMCHDKHYKTFFQWEDNRIADYWLIFLLHMPRFPHSAWMLLKREWVMGNLNGKFSGLIFNIRTKVFSGARLSISKLFSIFYAPSFLRSVFSIHCISLQNITKLISLYVFLKFFLKKSKKCACKIFLSLVWKDENLSVLPRPWILESNLY